MDLDISIFSTLKLKTNFYKQIIQIISLLLLPPSSSARTSTSFPSTSTTAAASSVFSSATFTSVASLSVSGNLLFSNKNLKCSSRFFAIQNSSKYFCKFFFLLLFLNDHQLPLPLKSHHLSIRHHKDSREIMWKLESLFTNHKSETEQTLCFTSEVCNLNALATRAFSLSFKEQPS